ncbi:MAG: peptide deformylase [Desulfurella sp.]|jgi:peptide deformylase|uniref:Peptide deformylase n=1 Tax=Desulfurella multipotens TaxID=79269 RepID=A0A1G6J060_9BACT|nr:MULTISPECIES: peptide deformylase [Desulfurella]AHF97488.1 peptide deformylase [Desulfurella acetivorans A63]HEX13826.1 peptide deformylase [Desulfurella acetivorans]PMP69425.1 MAG: peptide deformylase [Desulfurella multipotens]PMP91279.1 MAG: peptide deformylase [Desulfurella sp.]SDC12050.1 peptide deformylase [Desulfurella multipotens]
MDYKILTYPDKELKKVSSAVDKIDDSILELIDSMGRIMLKNNGIGLAAPQIGIKKRIIIVDERAIGANSNIIAMVNPKIVSYESFYEEHDEGCLSVPGFYGKVNDRRRYIKVQYLDLKEQVQEVEFDNFLSVVIQHEIDHLNGILFVDRINFVEKLRFKKFLKENK